VVVATIAVEADEAK